MASQLKVYVGLAHTLAPAGKCTARTARCSNEEDEDYRKTLSTSHCTLSRLQLVKGQLLN